MFQLVAVSGRAGTVMDVSTSTKEPEMSRITKAGQQFEKFLKPTYVCRTPVERFTLAQIVTQAEDRLSGLFEGVRLSDNNVETVLGMLQAHADSYPDSVVGQLVELHGNIAHQDNPWAKAQLVAGRAIRLTPRNLDNRPSDEDHGILVNVAGVLVAVYSGTGFGLDLPALGGRSDQASSCWVETVLQPLHLMSVHQVQGHLRMRDTSRWARSKAVADKLSNGVIDFRSKLTLDGKPVDTASDVSMITQALQTSQSQAYADATVKNTTKGKVNSIHGKGLNSGGERGAGSAILGKQFLPFTHRIRPVVELDQVTGQLIERDPIRTRKEARIWETNPAGTAAAPELFRCIAEDTPTWDQVAHLLEAAGQRIRVGGDTRPFSQQSNKGASAKSVIAYLVNGLLDGYVVMKTHPRKLPELPQALLEADDNTVPRIRVERTTTGQERYRITHWFEFPMDDHLRSIPRQHLLAIKERLEGRAGRGSSSGQRFPLLRTCEQDVDADTRRTLLSSYPRVYLCEISRDPETGKWPAAYAQARKLAVVNGTHLLAAVGDAVAEAAQRAAVGHTPLSGRSHTETALAQRQELATVLTSLERQNKVRETAADKQLVAEIEGNDVAAKQWAGAIERSLAETARLEARKRELEAGTAALPQRPVDANVSTLIAWAAALRRYPSLSDTAKATVTKATATFIGKSFTWAVSEDQLTAEFALTVDVFAEDGTNLVLPVSGSVPTTMVGQSRATDANVDSRRVTHLPRNVRELYTESVMAHGRDIRDIEKHRIGDKAVYQTPTWRYAARKLEELGVAEASRRAAILDCMLPETRAELWHALNHGPRDPWERNLLDQYTAPQPWVARRYVAVDDTNVTALHAFLKEHGPSTAAEIIAATGMLYVGTTSTIGWACVRDAVAGAKVLRLHGWGGWVRESASGSTPISQRTFSLIGCEHRGCPGHLYPLPVPEVPGGLACDTCRRIPGAPAQHAGVVPERYFATRLRLVAVGKKGRRPRIHSAA